MTGNCLALSSVCRIKTEASVKCLAQGHNKKNCALILNTIPFVLSAEKASCEYHFLKSIGISRREMNPRSTYCDADDLATAPSSHYLSALLLKSISATEKIKFFNEMNVFFAHLYS